MNDNRDSLKQKVGFSVIAKLMTKFATEIFRNVQPEALIIITVTL